MLVGELLFKVLGMTNKPGIGDEKETMETSRHALTEDTPQGYIGANTSDQTIPMLLDALCQPGKSSEIVSQAHHQEGMSVDGVPHVDPHIDYDADDGAWHSLPLMQLQWTFFESISDSSIVVVSTCGGFSSPAKEDGERDSEQMYSYAAKQCFR